MKTALLLAALLLAPSARAVWPNAVEALAASKPHLTNYVFSVAWDAQAGVAGYRVYWGTVRGSETNRVECGTATGATLMLPMQRCYVVVRSYSANDLESPPSNRIHYPGDEVVTATSTSGAMLAKSQTLDFGAQAFVASPHTVINPGTNMFFRAIDGGRLTISRTIKYSE